jgi:hypothetical protein
MAESGRKVEEDFEGLGIEKWGLRDEERDGCEARREDSREERCEEGRQGKEEGLESKEEEGEEGVIVDEGIVSPILCPLSSSSPKRLKSTASVGEANDSIFNSESKEVSFSGSYIRS